MKSNPILLLSAVLASGLAALSVSADPLSLSGSLIPTYATTDPATDPVGEAAMQVYPETRDFNITLNIVGLTNEMTAAYLQVDDGLPILDLDINVFDGDENLMVGAFSGIFPSDDLGSLLGGNVYINIETDAYPEGEIRGSLGLETEAGSQLLNFSCRGMVNPGNGKAGILIGGFVIGEAGETVLVRCIGDGLTKWGLKSLKDTALQIYDLEGNLMAENDNWKEDGQEFAILATGFAPDRDSDAAMIIDFPAGAYTVHGDSNKGAGIALVDMYGVEAKTVAGIINSAAKGIEASEFTILNQALSDTGLNVLLEGPGPFTLFAPTDEAFASQLDGLNIDQKTELLKYHLVAANYPSGELEAGDLLTIQGEAVTIGLTDMITVNDADVISADLLGTNGVVHVINKVLIPPTP